MPDNQEFEQEKKELEDVFLQHFKTLYDRLVAKISAAPDYAKWKKPKWGDTWQYQGLAGLGRRLFTGTDPRRDNLTWRMANAKKEGNYNELKIYAIIKEECHSLVESEMNENFTADINPRDLMVFRAEVENLLAFAMFKLYNLGRKHGKSPEEVLTPKEPETTKEPDGAEPVEPDEVASKPDEVTPKETAPPNNKWTPPIGTDAVGTDVVDADGDEEDAANPTEPEEVESPTNSDYDPTSADTDLEGLDTIPDEILEKLSAALSMEKVALVEERIGSSTENDDERKKRAIEFLINKIESTYEPTNVGAEEEWKQQALMAYTIKCLNGVSEDELKGLSQNNMEVIFHLCNFITCPLGNEDSKILPDKIGQSEEKNKDVDPGQPDVGEHSRGIAMTNLLKERFVPKGTYDRLVKLHYNPNLWFRANAFPKTVDAFESQGGGTGKKWKNWPRYLNDDSIAFHCDQAMLDLYIAVISGDLFPSHTDPHNVSDLMRGLVLGPEEDPKIKRYEHEANVFKALQHALSKKRTHEYRKAGKIKPKETATISEPEVEEEVAKEILAREQSGKYPNLSEKTKVDASPRLRTLINNAVKIPQNYPGEDPQGFNDSQLVRTNQYADKPPT